MFKNPSVKTGLIVFLATRIFISLWAVAVLAVIPLEAYDGRRSYLGEPALTEGAAGMFLGPWQRFDSQHYLRIARQGYAEEADSVFPPLYPLAIRGLGGLFGGGPVANLTAAIFIANLAYLGLLILLHHVAANELDSDTATRTLVYLALFPTGFFLLAPYTESLFILLALGAIWAGKNGRFWLAGGLGLLASLARLTGWILVVPLAYEYWRQHGAVRKTDAALKMWDTAVFAALLPGLGMAAFMLWRWQAGLPSLPVIYDRHWFQTTGFPGQDLVTAVNTFFFGGIARAGEFTFVFDFVVAFFLLATTIWTFRRLGATYGLYSALLLFFMLLPTSENYKPLFSFSRYALAFFPAFMLLGLVGKRPWLNRLILYSSLILYLYFSGQFFLWGWVA
ncbi:MAG: hypothetical protein GY803_19230 [Chloroflexi bacterium]|nr:hypothetical protein [Chloroflexota bacterium]